MRNYVTIEGSGDFAATPEGRSAVLEVTARPTGVARTGKSTWAVVQTPNAEGSFAELLAHAARADAAMDVMLPVDVAEALDVAGIEPTLQPSPEQLERLVATLGCDSYLTAEVTEWRYGYLFFSSWAAIECQVTCRSSAGGGPLWQVRVRRQARGMSDREVARLALSEAFAWLRGADAGSAPPNGPPGPAGRPQAASAEAHAP
ncbi:MAG: hypothetical protein AMK73_00505 [Planctomycetes bacterium SM23_32]|nr:MAG: hypothetical protein AMK73_00505 [Planctomycetes bacterium SM23_32]